MDEGRDLIKIHSERDHIWAKGERVEKAVGRKEKT